MHVNLPSIDLRAVEIEQLEQNQSFGTCSFGPIASLDDMKCMINEHVFMN